MPPDPLGRNYLISRAHQQHTNVSSMTGDGLRSVPLVRIGSTAGARFLLCPILEYYEQIQPTIGAPAEF